MYWPPFRWFAVMCLTATTATVPMCAVLSQEVVSGLQREAFVEELVAHLEKRKTSFRVRPAQPSPNAVADAAQFALTHKSNQPDRIMEATSEFMDRVALPLLSGDDAAVLAGMQTLGPERLQLLDEIMTETNYGCGLCGDELTNGEVLLKGYAIVLRSAQGQLAGIKQHDSLLPNAEASAHDRRDVALLWKPLEGEPFSGQPVKQSYNPEIKELEFSFLLADGSQRVVPNAALTPEDRQRFGEWLRDKRAEEKARGEAEKKARLYTLKDGGTVTKEKIDEFNNGLQVDSDRFTKKLSRQQQAVYRNATVNLKPVFKATRTGDKESLLKYMTELYTRSDVAVLKEIEWCMTSTPLATAVIACDDGRGVELRDAWREAVEFYTRRLHLGPKSQNASSAATVEGDTLPLWKPLEGEPFSGQPVKQSYNPEIKELEFSFLLADGSQRVVPNAALTPEDRQRFGEWLRDKRAEEKARGEAEKKARLYTLKDGGTVTKEKIDEFNADKMAELARFLPSLSRNNLDTFNKVIVAFMPVVAGTRAGNRDALVKCMTKLHQESEGAMVRGIEWLLTKTPLSASVIACDDGRAVEWRDAWREAGEVYARHKTK